MPSYTQTARESGVVRYAARPLRPALIMSNTARTAVSALPAGKPPSVCGKSAVKLRSRGEKCLVPCGFTGAENKRQYVSTFPPKNSVLLRNKQRKLYPHENGARCHLLAAAPRSFFANSSNNLFFFIFVLFRVRNALNHARYNVV